MNQDFMKTARILIVDDEPANLKLLERLLNAHGYRNIDPVNDSRDVIAHYQVLRPDLILLDINMPGMNGYELLKALRADGNLKDIPVIALTANAMPRDAERGLKAGFSAYLTKPLNVAEFFGTVDRYLAA